MLNSQCMAEVVDVLTPNSFKEATNDIKHSDIYGCIRSMYPTQIIDTLTITKELHKRSLSGVEVTRATIATFTNLVASTAHIQYHAFILVQEGMSEMLNNWINTKLTEAQKANELVTHTDLNHPSIIREKDFAAIRSHAAKVPDIFDRVEALRTFLATYNYKDELEELNDMSENINAKVKAIRKRMFTANILGHIKKMGHTTKQPEAIDTLVNIINEILDGTATPEIINQVHLLNRA